MALGHGGRLRPALLPAGRGAGQRLALVLGGRTACRVRLPPAHEGSDAAAAARRRRIRASIGERRGRSVVYLKGREEVANLLQLTGAHGALLEFAADQVGRDVQNRLNRLLNAEAANVNRTVRAAERQVRAIEQLDATHQLDALSPGLRAVADARRAYPAEDLETLAAGLDISRSAVHHRLRRLEQLAATPPRRRRAAG